MSHGHSILEMTRLYEKKKNKFSKMINDIMTNNTTYYGVLNLVKDLDLLFGLYSDDRKNAVVVVMYRAWPTIIEASEKPVIVYLSQVLNMFPEIRKIKFKKGDWPSPYGKQKVDNNKKQLTSKKRKELSCS